jgi:hypothetical protein
MSLASNKRRLAKLLCTLVLAMMSCLFADFFLSGSISSIVQCLAFLVLSAVTCWLLTLAIRARKQGIRGWLHQVAFYVPVGLLVSAACLLFYLSVWAFL